MAASSSALSAPRPTTKPPRTPSRSPRRGARTSHHLTSAPIEHLHTNLARTYTHIHPLVVCSIFAAQFPAIVADPVPALATALVPLGLAQTVYSVLCLPAAGTGAAAAAAGQEGAGGKGGKGVGKGRRKGGWSGKVVTSILSLLLTTLLGIPLLTVLLILFGAPLTTHLPHTLLAAAHIAYLSGVPLVYTHGVDAPKWKELIALMVPADEVFGAAVGTLVGAWAGAVPIPLDWDREWQKWPVTIVCGAYAGFAIGKFLGGVALKGRVFAFN
ncbi:PIG-F-domain-containing protein [Saccharata proteae CBS 121410]|uniref:PIG-F-domain-containing protein n=1 Tax=Saccharata proteae CBS 121410 TaxID=1314787 RepID=A0A9P4HWY3_9PEZI|nr:PIG-F-domain-containing protein [Saccharata proteae CBS 121410]